MATPRTRAPKSAPKPGSKPAPKAKGKAAAAPAARTSLAEAMTFLEKAGSAQTKKTYLRHGAVEPLFGVTLGDMKPLVKRIGVDHDLALALWDTGNFDARTLAFRIVDPARVTAKDLDRWVRDTTARGFSLYPAMLAAETPHGFATAERWLTSSDEALRSAGWTLVGQLAARDEATPDAWLSERLGEIESGIRTAPNAVRGAMNGALIAIGGRSPALRKAALAAAKRIGAVEVDHGDTACKTPEVAPYLEKMWAYAAAKGFASPSAQERAREAPRTRC